MSDEARGIDDVEIVATYTPPTGPDRVTVPPGGKLGHIYQGLSGQWFAVVHHPIRPGGVVETHAGEACGHIRINLPPG